MPIDGAVYLHADYKLNIIILDVWGLAWFLATILKKNTIHLINQKEKNVAGFWLFAF